MAALSALRSCVDGIVIAASWYQDDENDSYLVKFSGEEQRLFDVIWTAVGAYDCSIKGANPTIIGRVFFRVPMLSSLHSFDRRQ